MELLTIKNIRLEYNNREILNIEELEIYEYDRIGLVGANGAGKSTLMKVLLGEIQLPDCIRSGYGEFSTITQLEKGELSEEKDFSLIGKLGVSNFENQQQSGGEETRLKIANAFGKQAHGIFADEPTSHLDEAGICFLIQQFQAYHGPFLVISHDRYFLDQVVDKIWELKDGKITEYWGNYSEYERQKAQEQQAHKAKYDRVMAEKQRLQAAAMEKVKQAKKIEQKDRSKKKNTEGGGRLGHQKSTGSKQKKLHQAAKSIQKRIVDLEEVEAPVSMRKIRFRQSKALELHNPFPIMGESISKQVGDKVLFEKASFSFPLGEKIAITGGNGMGKSTLLQMILDKEAGISVSPKAKIGYFAQNSYRSNGDKKVLEFMMEECDYNVSEIRAILASMGFSQTDINKELCVLSGGELIKLNLAKLLTGRYNILFLDEPGNYLDLDSLKALESMIKDYQGTIVLITHDKQLRDAVATVVFEIQEHKLIRIK